MKFPGAGEIVLGLNDLEQSAAYRMVGINDPKQVERLIRETVLHPRIDELLFGKRTLAELRRGSASEDDQTAAGDVQSQVVPPEQNIKKLMAGSKMTNVKKFRSAIAMKMDEIDDGPREKVQAELTDGEEVLWVDTPQADVKGRGIVGALIGSAVRKEPPYELYAITNRRVLLWANKDTSVDTPQSTSQYNNTGDMSLRGPPSYYPPDLAGVSLEEDKRIEDGGSIVFKSVRIVITTTTTKGDRHLPGSTKVRKKEEIHCFGILRIRNVKAVMRLLYDRLIAPCKS